MKILELLFKRETIAPMLAMTFASAVSVTLVFARIVWTGNLRYGFLVWNLFLAWLPLIFALMARERYWNGPRPKGYSDEPTPNPSKEGSIFGRAIANVPLLPAFTPFRRGRARAAGGGGGRVRGGLRNRNWRFIGLAGAWLLFFPNAPYIFTDLIHLTSRFSRHFWLDMTLILICALTGLVLGFVSLYLMHSVVTRMLGRVAGWLFVGASAGLCSFGIYLGRFLRFNSWDVFLRPDKIYRGIDMWLDMRVPHLSSAAFLILFATFLFVAYVMLYGLTHLPRAREMALPPGTQELSEA